MRWYRKNNQIMQLYMLLYHCNFKYWNESAILYDSLVISLISCFHSIVNNNIYIASCWMLKKEELELCVNGNFGLLEMVLI